MTRQWKPSEERLEMAVPAAAQAAGRTVYHARWAPHRQHTTLVCYFHPRPQRPPRPRAAQPLRPENSKLTIARRFAFCRSGSVGHHAGAVLAAQRQQHRQQHQQAHPGTQQQRGGHIQRRWRDREEGGRGVCVCVRSCSELPSHTLSPQPPAQHPPTWRLARSSRPAAAAGDGRRCAAR